MQTKPTGSWLAKYVQTYGKLKHEKQEQLLLVSYRFPEKPSRMFYYKLEDLLMAVNGRRLQKSVIIIPERALAPVRSLCQEYRGTVFAAKYGGEPIAD